MPALLESEPQIIDPVAARQIAVVPESGVTGDEVATSPDGLTAFVPIYGDLGVGKLVRDAEFFGRAMLKANA